MIGTKTEASLETIIQRNLKMKKRILKLRKNEMKAYKVTVNVRFDEDYDEYIMTEPESTDSYREATLCREVYEEVIGEEVVGEVTFILRKIKGKATDYISPFSIRKDALHIHDGRKWYYAKYLEILERAMDVKELKKWAGKSIFSVEMEY